MGRDIEGTKSLQLSKCFDDKVLRISRLDLVCTAQTPLLYKRAGRGQECRDASSVRSSNRRPTACCWKPLLLKEDRFAALCQENNTMR